MKLTLAYSPCPNDTFMFHALTTGLIELGDLELETHLHDVETLNQRAGEGSYDLTKLSFSAFLRVGGEYTLLRSGGAMALGCGPVVVSRSEVSRSDFPSLRVAIPGELTTAHLLFQVWAPRTAGKIFAPYDQILDLVARGEADCGVVIHESRFVIDRFAMNWVADLGQWWNKQTGLPVPLGGIAARRSLPDQVRSEIEEMIRLSVQQAIREPRQALDHAREFAQELDCEIVAQHVETFVNDYSVDMGEDGLAAIRRLRQMAVEAGFVS